MDESSGENMLSRLFCSAEVDAIEAGGVGETRGPATCVRACEGWAEARGGRASAAGARAATTLAAPTAA